MLHQFSGSEITQRRCWTLSQKGQKDESEKLNTLILLGVIHKWRHTIIWYFLIPLSRYAISSKAILTKSFSPPSWVNFTNVLWAAFTHAEKLLDMTVFLRFWDLQAKKLLVERWWNWHLICGLQYRQVDYKMFEHDLAKKSFTDKSFRGFYGKLHCETKIRF